ncbi:MAG: ubiquinol oxidase subunit II [Alcanivorax sp.]|nr:ubiquinol oxidase subunit II [Alcanivorax sp.]
MPLLKSFSKLFLTASSFALLAGCDAVVMSPSGDVAVQQRDLIIWSTILMLLIIVPVIILTLFFAWRYRASNTKATYKPEWDHSTVLELVIWSAPLMIIIALGALTWVTTHQLDPYRPLDRIGPDRPVTAEMKPLVIEAVSMDWKWLFFYPEQGIATVNEIAAPVDRPIQFKITSTANMNSFFIPALAGQIYAMGGMETKLHAVINKPGVYKGFSANYSGAGYSDMKFKFHGVSDADFDSWVQKVKDQGDDLSYAKYRKLEEKSVNDPVHYYSSVADGLYDKILNRCIDPGTVCMKDLMSSHPIHEGGEHEESAHEHEE